MKTEKRKHYSATEKALLLEAYKSSRVGKKEWCTKKSKTSHSLGKHGDRGSVF